MSTIGERISFLRHQFNLSQRELVSEIDGRVSYSYLSRLETGTRNPSWKALAEIADALNNHSYPGHPEISGLFLLRGKTGAPVAYPHGVRGFPACPFCHR